MPDSSARILRRPSWWAEGLQFAKWDPFGFGVLTMPLLLFVMPLHWIPQAWVLLWTLVALIKGGELFHLPSRRGRAVPLLLFVMPLHWIPQAWVLLWTLVALIKGGELFHLPSRRGRAVPLLSMVFLGWMWSSVFYGMPAGWEAPTLAVLNGLSLVLFLLGVWRLARRPSRLEWMLQGIIGIGVLTAVISFPIYYLVRGHNLPADRLENVIPYGFHGLYAVNSGMLWAFAGVAAAAGFTQTESPRQRTLLATALAVLIAAVFLTQTRGALLGVGVALVILMLTRPLPRWSPVVAVIVMTGWTCQNLPRLIPAVFPSVPSAGEVLLATPGDHMLSRADSGRLQLYQELWRRVEGAAEVVMGRGFWAKDTAEPIEIAWPAPHPHGAFISTAYHGGLIGLGLLGLLVWAGARRSIWLAQRGIDVRWLAFLGAGGASLCLDGHTLALFQTVPLFEPLLFWLPLIAGASLATKVLEDTPAETFTEEAI